MEKIRHLAGKTGCAGKDVKQVNVIKRQRCKCTDVKNVLRGWKRAVSNSIASCRERAQQMECLFLMLSGGQPEGGRAEEFSFLLEVKGLK